MRLIHTSDWHLGHSLHEIPRRAEHQAFLAWLLDQLQTLAADALLVAGDLYDSANPPAEAQADLYGFLAEARRRMPALDIVLIAGNHDSAARLDAPEPLLQAFGVRVVGSVPRHPDGTLDAARFIVPLTDHSGQVAAQVIAMPFLRPADLPVIQNAQGAQDEGADPLIEGVRRVYAMAIALAEQQRQPGQALLAMGHLYMAGTALSELSERKILGGNQHALPADLFPATLSYVALGHLHRAQAVGRDGIRYSGSPLPLSMAELDYRHQILVVDLHADAPAVVTEVRIPRTVELLRVPALPQPIEVVEAALRSLHAGAELPAERHPILEVPVRLTQPEHGLRTRIEAALTGKNVRLARIVTHYSGTGDALAEALPHTALQDLPPEDVLRRRWARTHEGEPPATLLAAFHQLLGEAQADAESA